MNTRLSPVRILTGMVALIIASGAFTYVAIGDQGVATAPGSQRLEVTLDEWTVEPGVPSIAAGKTTVVVSNTGELEHELLALRLDDDKADLAADELPAGIAGPVPKLAGKLLLGKAHRHVATNDSYAVLDREPDANTERHVLPGGERAFEADLTPGSYVLYCSLPGHYFHGQATRFEVTE